MQPEFEKIPVEVRALLTLGCIQYRPKGLLGSVGGTPPTEGSA